MFAAPFLLFAGLGAVIFFLATAWLLGREYFELAAMRFRPASGSEGPAQAQRRDGLCRRPADRRLCVDPIVNLATPLFAMALMVHVHKRLARVKAIAR